MRNKDRKLIREMIREEFKEALFREITVKKAAKVPGEVDGKIETSTQNLLDQLVMDLPVWVQSLALAEDAAVKSADKSIEATAKINALSGILIPLEDSIMTMIRFTNALKETGLLDQLEKALEIEYIGSQAIGNEANTG